MGALLKNKLRHVNVLIIVGGGVGIVDVAADVGLSYRFEATKYDTFEPIKCIRSNDLMNR